MRGRWTKALPALLGLAVACRGPEEIVLDPALGVDYYIVFRGDGPQLKGSALTPLRRSVGLDSLGDGEVFVAGYSQASLEALQIDLSSAGSSDKIVGPASPCDRRLPEPAWYARWTEADGATRVSPHEAPALTTTAIELGCPKPRESISIAFLCNKAKCSPPSRALDDCEFVLATKSCLGGDLRGSVCANGDVCLDFSETDWACDRIDSAPQSSGSFVCERPPGEECKIDAYRAETLNSAPPFTVERRDLVGGAVYRPDSLTQVALRRGQAYDLVVLEERVIVATRAGAEVEHLCSFQSNVPTKLWTIDPKDSLATTATTSWLAAPCTRDLTRDPMSAGFLATYADPSGAGMRLGRFTADGVPTTTVAIDAPRDPRSERVLELVVLEEAGVVALLTQPHDNDDTHDLVTFDLDELQRLDREPTPHAWDPRVMTAAGATDVAITREGHPVAWYAAAGTRAPEFSSADMGSVFEGSVMTAFHHPSSDVLVVTKVGEIDLYLVDRTANRVDGRALFEVNGDLVAAAEWPSDPRVVLATGLDDRQGGFIVLVDPVKRRILPGTWPIGHGVVRRIRRGAGDQLWMVLGWSGEIIRLTPSSGQ